MVGHAKPHGGCEGMEREPHRGADRVEQSIHHLEGADHHGDAVCARPPEREFDPDPGIGEFGLVTQDGGIDERHDLVGERGPAVAAAVDDGTGREFDVVLGEARTEHRGVRQQSKEAFVQV